MLVKRKAIQLSRQTLVVSLPSAWVKQYGIVKGQDIDILAQGPRLVISSEGSSGEPKILKAKQGRLGKLLHRFIFKAYQHGVDEIHLDIEDPSVMGPLKNKLHELIGYEITQQSKNHCVIKDISGQNSSEFNDAMGRLFLITKNLLSDSTEALKNGAQDQIPLLIERDQDVNKFANFCLRLLSKTNGRMEHSEVFFHLILTLERIGDGIKKLLVDVKEHDMSLGPEETRYLADLCTLLHHCYTLTLNPKLSKAQDIADLYDRLSIARMALSNVHRAGQGASALAHHLGLLTEQILSLQEAQLHRIDDHF